MAKGQGLDDIIRDAIKGQMPKRKTRPIKFPRVNDDIATDPLSHIRGPRKKMPRENPKGEQRTYGKKPNVSDKAANKGKRVRVPKPEGDRRMYAKYMRVYGSGQKGGMR